MELNSCRVLGNHVKNKTYTFLGSFFYFLSQYHTPTYKRQYPTKTRLLYEYERIGSCAAIGWSRLHNLPFLGKKTF